LIAFAQSVSATLLIDPLSNHLFHFVHLKSLVIHFPYEAMQQNDVIAKRRFLNLFKESMSLKPIHRQQDNERLLFTAIWF
jgi:hypothetical protein